MRTKPSRVLLTVIVLIGLAGCSPGMRFQEIIPCKSQPWFESIKSTAKELTPHNYQLKAVESECASETGLATFDITSVDPLKDFKRYFNQKALSLGWEATRDDMSYRKCVGNLDTNMYLITNQGETKRHQIEFEALDGDGDGRCS